MFKSLILTLLFLSLHFLPSFSTDNNGNMKLFVFGDSYADTGNWNTIANSWKTPYGMTFPGKPAGRFSDGRILTDYIALYLQIESPVPYEQWNTLSSSEKSNRSKLEFGMNFAYGGTGVFDTVIPRPNMTSQIDIFERLIDQSKVYTKPDFNNSSIALVSVGGNDYSNYIKHPVNLSVPEFTKSIINQLRTNLERIHSFGLQKIAVTTMEPLGCLPAITFLRGYKNCTQSLNEVSSFHNTLLQQSVDLLNNKTKDGTFFTLDLYGAFMSSLQPGNSNAVGPLEPCCKGVTAVDVCGSVEGNVPKYTVCAKPDSAFFWDQVHPAQNGWHQVYESIQPTLRKILLPQSLYEVPQKVPNVSFGPSLNKVQPLLYFFFVVCYLCLL